MSSVPTPPPASSRMRTWLERVGLTILGVGAYVVWGLLNGDNLYGLLLVPLVVGMLGGFLVMGLSLSEKVSGPVLTLIYLAALAGVGGLTWLFTGDWGVAAGVVVLPGVLGLFFLAAGLSAWRESRRQPAGTKNGPAV